jgi:hypothetical protein
MPSKFSNLLFVFLLNSKCTKFISRIKRIIVNSCIFKIRQKLLWKLLVEVMNIIFQFYFSLKFFNAKLGASLGWNWRLQVLTSCLFHSISLPSSCNFLSWILSTFYFKLFIFPFNFQLQFLFSCQLILFSNAKTRARFVKCFPRRFCVVQKLFNL